MITPKRIKHTFRLPPALSSQLADYAGRKRISQALVVETALDLAKFKAHVEKNLPTYARPIFLRLQGEIEVTGTFKHRKIELVKEGFDPELIKEPLYFLDPVDGHYVNLTVELFDRIMAGEVRL